VTGQRASGGGVSKRFGSTENLADSGSGRGPAMPPDHRKHAGQMETLGPGRHAGGQRLPSEELPPPPSPATLMTATRPPANHDEPQVLA